MTLAAFLLVVVTVALPAFWTPGFGLLSGWAWAFYGLLAAYVAAGLLAYDWLKAWSERWWPWAFFGLQAAVFAAVLALPVPRAHAWLLAMPVVSFAVTCLGWRAVAAVTAVFLGIFVWFLWRVGVRPADLLTSALSVFAGMAFTAGFTAMTRWANQSRERAERLAGELESANRQLRETAARDAALATERERNRIARDIHDGLGHSLTVVAVQLQAARALLAQDPARAAAAIEKAEQAGRAALDEVRRSVGALRAAGPRPALRESLAGLVAESGLPAELAVEGEVRPVPDAAEQAIFRTVQEGLTNVRKHAAARWTRVALDFRDPARVTVAVADDGRGAPAPNGGGFGLVGLRERAAELGGRLTAESGATGGFVLRLEVPA